MQTSKKKKTKQNKKLKTKKVWANRVQQYLQRITHHDQVGFIPGMQLMVQHPQTSQWYTILTNWRIKTYDQLNRCRKSMWQNATLVYDKNWQQSGHRGNLPRHSNGLMWQAHNSCRIQWWQAKSFSSKIRSKTRMPALTPLLLNIVSEVLAREFGAGGEKGNQGHPN